MSYFKDLDIQLQELKDSDNYVKGLTEIHKTLGEFIGKFGIEGKVEHDVVELYIKISNEIEVIDREMKEFAERTRMTDEQIEEMFSYYEEEYLC